MIPTPPLTKTTPLWEISTPLGQETTPLREGVSFCIKDGILLDPFAGTGTFMAELIASDIISDKELPHKYKCELHSNEILLLAYYIMTINIEQAYHARMGGEYVSFEGAVLTDTFQMTEEGDTLDTEVFTQNSERVLAQNKLPIRVIVGNPPYSAGQKNANDNNANENYPSLDARIAETYAARTDATNKNSLYDSYIRAFRWASDRVGDKGVICFVSNAGWVDGQAMSGMRKCLADEFSSIWVFHLRGNQRTQGEESRKEGGKIFGSGSRAPIAITMLVKNPNSIDHGSIRYYDVGDYLSREQKLSIVREAAYEKTDEWVTVVPDRHGDWLNQRDDSFYDFAPMGIEKRKPPLGMFEIWSSGLKTQRDPWAWGYSDASVAANMERLMSEMNAEMKVAKKEKRKVRYDTERFSWTRRMLDFAGKCNLLEYDKSCVRLGTYRPFCKQWVYYDRVMNERTYQQPMVSSMLAEKGGVEMTYQQHSSRCYGNLVISVSERGCLVTDHLPDLELIHHGQCFPLYWYEEADSPELVGDNGQQSLFGAQSGEQMRLGDDQSQCAYIRHDAITDEALHVFRAVYPGAFGARHGRKPRAKKDGGPELTKEDIFYYIYGILHSEEYRTRFEANLKKELPRIPLAEDFASFAIAGRALANLHLNYEMIDPWPGIVEEGDSANPGRTEKMHFGKCAKDDEHPKGEDVTVLRVAENLTLRNIPVRAYDYVVNGKSAIGWLMDRYQVRTDKPSGIVNDPNDYSDDPRYIVDLVKRVVRVSMETLEIVSSLPALKEKPQPANWPFAWKIQE